MKELNSENKDKKDNDALFRKSVTAAKVHSERKAVTRRQGDILHGKQSSCIQSALHSPVYIQFKVLLSNRSTDTENRLIITSGEGKGGWNIAVGD